MSVFCAGASCINISKYGGVENMRKKLLLASLLGLCLAQLLAINASASPVIAGATCSKQGATTVVNGAKFACANIPGGKRIWQGPIFKVKLTPVTDPNPQFRLGGTCTADDSGNLACVGVQQPHDATNIKTSESTGNVWVGEQYRIAVSTVPAQPNTEILVAWAQSDTCPNGLIFAKGKVCVSQKPVLFCTDANGEAILGTNVWRTLGTAVTRGKSSSGKDPAVGTPILITGFKVIINPLPKSWAPNSLGVLLAENANNGLRADGPNAKLGCKFHPEGSVESSELTMTVLFA